MAKCDELLHQNLDISLCSSDVLFSLEHESRDTVLDPLSDDPYLVLSVLEPVLIETPEPPAESYDNQLEIKNEGLKTGTSYVCKYPGCHKKFTRHNYLKVHSKIHNREKAFVCQFTDCEKSFTTKYALQVHQRIHTGERPYKCTKCDKCFKTSNDRNVHEITHKDSRPYSCSSCTQSFKTIRSLKSHIKSVHDNVKNFECDICEKRFANNGNLNNHRNKHLNIKPYVCTVQECSKAFVEYSSLFKHRFVHLVGPLLKCNVCDTSYPTKFDLMKHKKVCERDLCEKFGRGEKLFFFHAAPKEES
ncbi:gastrula zinc finger protein XlCGF7.1-like [Artemia franciscana]